MIPKLLPTLNCRLDQSHLLQLCQISPQYQDLYHCRLHQLLSENILNCNYTKSHKSAKIFENFRSKKSYNLKEDLHYLANNDFFFVRFLPLFCPKHLVLTVLFLNSVSSIFFQMKSYKCTSMTHSFGLLRTLERANPEEHFCSQFRA